MTLLLSTGDPARVAERVIRGHSLVLREETKEKKLITALFLIMSFVIYKKASSFVLSSQKGHL